MISLIGLPGSGKSTVGRQLARRLSLPFIDSDAEIEKRFKCSVAEYFECEGEAGFRDVEQVVIADLCVSHSAAAMATVLSTGGGTVLREANRAMLQANGHVVYLRCSPDDVFKRLRYDRNRPLLQVSDPLQRLRDMYVERDPLYRETAHYVVETGRTSVAALVNMIVMQLELAGVNLSSAKLANSAQRTGPAGTE